MRLDGLVVLAELTDRFEADVLIAALKAERIPATIAEDSRRSMLGGGLLGPGTHGADPVVEVLVPAVRLDEARAVLDVTTVGDAALPPEFRDEVWDDHVGAGRRRRRNLRRRWVLFWIYALFAVVVVILLVGVVSSVLH
jgi:hypothetical protein